MPEDKQGNVWQKIIEWQPRYRFSILAIIGIITAFFMYEITCRVSITTDFFKLYPPKHRYIQLYKQYRSMFGTENGRLAEEYQWQTNYESALFTSINTTGKAVIFTATSLIGGTVPRVFSDMKFQSEMVMLLCFLMFFNMLGALILIPAVVAVIGPERTIRKYKVD